MNPHAEIPRIETWLREEFARRGFTKAVLGISGGIDSAVAATLAARALGAENVDGLIMPYRDSMRQSTGRAMELITRLHIWHCFVGVPGLPVGSTTPLRIGNAVARMRMAMLYDHAAERNALVVGTSNKTEILLGYGTRWGDCACDINPLGEFYKTEVRQLAEALGVPESIRNAVPSAELWEGQTDEGELGMSYDEIDAVLMRPQCTDTSEASRKVWQRVARNRFKSEPIPVYPYRQ